MQQLKSLLQYKIPRLMQWWNMCTRLWVTCHVRSMCLAMKLHKTKFPWCNAHHNWSCTCTISIWAGLNTQCALCSRLEMHAILWTRCDGQKQCARNSEREVCTHCELNEFTMIKQDWLSKCGTTSCDGPHPMTKINNNSAVQVQMNDTHDAITSTN